MKVLPTVGQSSQLSFDTTHWNAQFLPTRDTDVNRPSGHQGDQVLAQPSSRGALTRLQLLRLQS